MADFGPAFEAMIHNEGGYQLTNIAGDKGGQTYAGIARNFNANWAGWRYVDANDMNNPALSGLVKDFYKTGFWDKLSGDSITKQTIAASIFDFAVNAGVMTAAKLAQQVVGVIQDGLIGSQSIAAFNAMDEGTFILKYALAKIAHYAQICTQDRGQIQFLLGWINRTVKGLP